ncbi:helix-turn-helix domain-containing protein [Streptomyces sp. SAJ15]|uniref:helix-turn-helix domain-containing protein n=1 Tax=Streptomyces sp. SAJ15 TaxID=2011095 RepID=UPI00164297D0|nr:helix-turn-helix domain-containing protein [Streptomyces sp. SAJ15]
MRREDLGRMLRGWRRARDPRLIPAPVPSRGHRTYLTQLDMALLLGVSERWYRALEKGEDRRYGVEMIAGIVRILDLDPRQAAALYRGTGHRPPRHPHAAARPAPALLELMHQQRCVSYLADQAWDVVGANAIAARHCPWLVRPGANVMTWAFSPEARYQLRDWERSWAAPLLDRLRLAWQRWPDNDRLDEVVRAVRGAPGVRELWDAQAPARLSDDGLSDDAPRPGYFPLVAPDPIDVRVSAFAPYDDRSLRWVMISPVDPGVTFP